MSDEKLERDLHRVLDRMMAEQASPSLRARVGAVLASPRNTERTWLRFAPRLAGGLIAAVVVVALGAVLATQPRSTGPAPVPSLSPTASAAAPSAAPTITVPVGTPPTSWSVVPDAPVLDFGGVNWAVDAVAPDGTFVAIVSRIGESPVALRSADGTTWTAAGPFPGSSDMWVNAITRRGDMLIAVGTGGHAAAGAAWTSSDGATWQRVADQPAFAQAALDRVAAGPAGVVAVDRFDGRLLVSADGATWSPVSLGAAGAVKVNDVAATDTGFVAVGSVGSAAAVWTSSDLQHWARAPFPDGSDASAQLVAVAAQGQRLVALGAVPAPGEAANDPWTGLGVWISTDGGASWTLSGTTLRGDAPVLYPSSMPGLSALSGGFVAFGNALPGALAVWTSSDGTSWRQATVQAASAAAGRTLAISGARAVIAGNDLGTGMGGSRAIFWTGVVGAAVDLCTAASNAGTQLVTVQQESMRPTLLAGDVISVTSLAAADLQRGDMVAFDPTTWLKAAAPPFVMRIVALGDDQVAIRGGHVFVNGAQLDEPYVLDGEPTVVQSGAAATWQIPADGSFVLGDNRSSAADSRAYGPLPVAAIVGRVTYRCEPPSRRGLIASPAQLSSASPSPVASP